MSVALQLDFTEETTVVVPKLKSPQVVTDTDRYLIKVGFSEKSTDAFQQEDIRVRHASIDDAIRSLRLGEVPQAILLSTRDFSYKFETLKQEAKLRAIPMVLYTPRFENLAKELALKNGLDEYHYGAINDVFLKRTEFIKRLKDYKNERGNKPFSTKTAIADVPQFKMWTLKRTFDIMVSLTGLILLSPILLVIAALVKLESRGPVFYISKRAGAGYKVFDFYKFRSMRVGADAELAKLAHLNQYTENNSNGVFFKLKNDPRVTRMGEFIRKTSLDELPQLFNVLKGDMSLVGNRPLPLYEAAQLTKDQIAWRFLAPAGITGLWQVTKRGKEDMSPEERIALDMEYAMKNSFILDLKILLSTVPALLQKEKV